MKGCIPLVALMNYSPSNLFIIGGLASASPQSLTQTMARLTISSAPQPATKPVLIIGEGEVEQVLEIGGMPRTIRVYQRKELTKVKER